MTQKITVEEKAHFITGEFSGNFTMRLYDSGVQVAWLTGKVESDPTGEYAAETMEPLYNRKLARYAKPKPRGMLHIEKVMVHPANRGRGYSAALVAEAIRRYREPGMWVWAEVGSGVIYKNFRKSLPPPTLACREGKGLGSGCTRIIADDATILSQLWMNPIENERIDPLSFNVGNVPSVSVFWSD